MTHDTDPCCIALDIDCAAVCRLAAATMARGNGFAQRFGALCAEICEECGQACGHERGQACGRQCAQPCGDCAPARDAVSA